MENTDTWETTEVLVCGGGPTGAILSASLGQMCVSNVVLEREPDITTDPRGIALDEDGIRLLQSIGAYDQIYTKVGSCMERFNFVGGVHNDLSKKPFMAMDYGTTEGGTGHVGFICHKQPALERAIRDAIDRNSFSQIRENSTVNSIAEDEDMVYVKYSDINGAERRIRARFFVGADGKTGFTRKKYLEPRGIKLERCSDMHYEETWVALNWQMTLPTRKTHPNFPLWNLGYTPEDVYDLFFPKEFRFLCNPSRPAVCGRFGLYADRLWRFEFVVHKDEDGQAMAGPESIRSIIFPYITHPGSRYGLSRPVQYPEDCITILRSRPFSFSARSCNKWALGRVILAGDAAHVFPPFGGQGIASGFRDASALAWRLAVLCQNPQTSNHERLLTAWYSERKQQLERSLAATIENGAYVTEADPLKVFIRDWYLWALQLVPGWKRWLEQGARREGMARYQYTAGMAFLPELKGGICLPQVYCAMFREGKWADIFFTDDLIFAAGKKGLFQLVVLTDHVEDISSATNALANVDQLSGGHIHSEEVTYIVQDVNAPCFDHAKASSGSNCRVARLATAKEFAADTKLCGNRPAPKYYDEHRLKREVGAEKFVIVRPDRFVYAACSTEEDLTRALQSISLTLEGR